MALKVSMIHYSQQATLQDTGLSPVLIAAPSFLLKATFASNFPFKFSILTSSSALAGEVCGQDRELQQLSLL